MQSRPSAALSSVQNAGTVLMRLATCSRCRTTCSQIRCLRSRPITAPSRQVPPRWNSRDRMTALPAIHPHSASSPNRSPPQAQCRSRKRRPPRLPPHRAFPKASPFRRKPPLPRPSHLQAIPPRTGRIRRLAICKAFSRPFLSRSRRLASHPFRNRLSILQRSPAPLSRALSFAPTMRASGCTGGRQFRPRAFPCR